MVVAIHIAHTHSKRVRIAANCSFVLILRNRKKLGQFVYMFMWLVLFCPFATQEKGWTRQMKCLPVQINSSTSNNRYLYIYICTYYMIFTYRKFTVVVIRCICKTQSTHLRGLALLYKIYVPTYDSSLYVSYMFMGIIIYH